MKSAALLVGVLLAGTARATAEIPIERGLTIRPAAVLDFPDRSGRPLGTLPANAAVDVYERRRLWLRISPPAGAAGPAGWLPLTELRLGGMTQQAAAPAQAADGAFSAFSRSVSGLLAGFNSRQSGYTASNATIGIRGLTSSELSAAAPNYQAYTDIERYRVMPAQAQAFAFAGGLVPQRIMYVTAPPATAPGGGR
jgi:hypothetical protein